ncbi:solute carrier family 25 member 35 [Nannochloropsis oceanica]
MSAPLTTITTPITKRKRGRPEHQKTWLQEFLLGGVSTSVACLFSNPFDVLKVRMQLQGELKSKGTYQVHYRNFLHAAWTIMRVEGILALQKGLGPAILYQFVMNGVRLGTFQTLVNRGVTADNEMRTREQGGHTRSMRTMSSGSSNSSSSGISSNSGGGKLARSALAGALGGALGGVVGSPLYLVKTQLQSRALQAIAVGHQHHHTSTYQALREIHMQHGYRGLWRGVEGAVPRLMLGSALQLSTFSYIKEAVRKWGWVDEGWVPVLASLLSSVNIILFMEPLDVVRTRLYNQPTDERGRGIYYRGFVDCFTRVVEKEGFFHGMYKGAGAAYFRMAPQAILGLSFWDSFRRIWYGRGFGRNGNEEMEE